MRQVIVDAPGKNGRIAILNDDVKAAREIAGGSRIESDKRLFAQKTMRFLLTWGRAAPLWITAAFLATTWASETQGFPEARHAQVDELANTQHAIAAHKVDFGGMAGDHDFETVQASRFGDKSVRVDRLEQDLAAAKRDVEAQKTLAAKANDDATQLKQAAASDAADLKKSLQQEGERAERLENNLAAVRRDVETRTELAAKANDDATQLKQAAES